VGCGVIGNTADSGSVVLGSSPGTPATSASSAFGPIMVAMPERLVVAINPRASFGKNKHVGRLVSQALDTAGYEVESCQGSSLAELEATVRAALATPAKALVVVGGDGMVHLGVLMATQFDIPLGLIPSGTGNDVARHLEIPLGSPEQALALLLEALARGPREIDYGISTSPNGQTIPFVCVLSAGFDAIVNERANRLRFPKGRHRYTVALLVELAKLRPLDYTVTIDGEDLSGQYLLVAVANARSFGGGMNVTPEAVIDDGWLDVLLVKPLSRWEFLKIYPRVFKGTHVTDPRVIIRQARTVSVDAEGVVAYADGEAMSALPVTVSLRPRGLLIFA
jgi:diacylglycerol kinase (ATP)